MIKPHYFALLLVPFLLGGSAPPVARNLDLTKLSGNIRLTLKHGVWKLWEEKPIYQDMTIDLVCDRGQCQKEVWGYAPKFNQDLDHPGTLEANNLSNPNSPNAWRLQVQMPVQFHPWQPDQATANYNIELVPYRGKLIGSYQGTFNDLSLTGSVTGTIAPFWPIPVANHRPLEAKEHPRLAFRASQLPMLRKRAKTPTGEAILAQLRKTLAQKVYYDGYVPNGGYHAAGYCFLSVLTEDKEAAEKGWQLVENSLKNPGRRLLEHAPIVAGVALAYDMCYPAWNEERRRKIALWLAGQADWLLKGDSPKNGWNNNPASNWSARARGAAGLAALAILQEPEITENDPYQLSRRAGRHIQRYLSTALGDRGFGIEGDHYTTEPLILSVLPFLIGYQNVLGEDWVTGANAQWILPQYLMRAIATNDSLDVATYGRHRNYAGSSLFALGIATVPDSLLPGIMTFFDRYLGMEGDRTFGIHSPHEAAFLLSYYPENTKKQNPADLFERVFVDETRGFYSFRDQWQGKDDFVANIYLKRQSIKGVWSFPDVGSFRIWGLGGRWASPGASELSPIEENGVVLPDAKPWVRSKPIFFQSHPDGSGVVSLQTDAIRTRNQGIAAVRSLAVDYSGLAGVPGLFALSDQFVGDVNAPAFQKKVWVMNTEENVAIEGRSFTLKAANGATMKGTFLAPTQVKIRFEKTETGGRILATGGNEFFVIMTVQKGKAPDLKITGSGLTAQVKIGKQEVFVQGDRIVLLNMP